MNDEPVTVSRDDNPTPALRFIGTPEAQATLVEKLAEARADFTEVKKGKQGQTGAQKFLYSPLGVLTDASMVHLNKRGIFVCQPITESPAEGKQRVTLIIMGHGARIEAWYDFKPVQEIKEYGKDTTYRRRYQYNSFFVLDGEPDADEARRMAEDNRDPSKREIADGQLNTIKGMMDKLGITDQADKAAKAAKILGDNKPVAKYTYADGDTIIKALSKELGPVTGKGKKQ